MIAAEAGVSLPTVSKVLNGRSDVAADTRQRVERLLRDRHYLRPGGRTGRPSGLVELLFTQIDSPWAVELLRGVEDYLAEHRRAVVVGAIRHSTDASGSAGWTGSPIGPQPDGVILVSSDLSADQWHDLGRRGLPIVVIDPANVPGPDIPSVGATNWAGGIAATEHLLALGHRRIAVVSGSREILCSRARVDGYRFALERAGIAVDPALVRFGEFRQQSGFDCAHELLALPDPPTAMFAGSDQQALGVYEAVRRLGLTIPGDLSVVGFDDLPVARWLSPPLTTVRQPLGAIGRVAAEMLVRRIDDAGFCTQRMELATELIVRESTEAPAADMRRHSA